MTARMKISGTSLSYRGLYACTAGAVVLTSAAIDAVPADFPEISRPTGFLKSMVELDDVESPQGHRKSRLDDARRPSGPRPGGGSGAHG
jgi:hypothetical protein